MTWSISPDITAATGLLFSTSTGAVSGTPNRLVLTYQQFTITGSNTGGAFQANIGIRVVDGKP